MRVGITTSSFAEADPAPLHRLAAAGVEVVPNPYGRRLTREESVAFVRDLDGLVAGLEPLDRGVLESAPELKALARVGIGMDNVDLEAAADLGIKVSNTPAPPSIAVAELTLTAMLAMLRGFVETTHDMREGIWRKEIQGSLDGATVLVVGLGRIGRRVASLVHAFGANCLGVDPFLAPNEAPPGVTIVPLHEGLIEADVITLHASGAQPIITEHEFGLVKAGAILLNASRGTLVDEEALGRALNVGHLRSAWFDAFWEEPYRGQLLQHPNFLATPHVATYTSRCRLTMETQAVENVLRDLDLGRT